MTASSTPRASAVSAALRRGGLQPSGSAARGKREGLRVTQSYQSVRVCADVDRPARSRALATEARDVLRAAGYACDADIALDAYAAFYVTGRA